MAIIEGDAPVALDPDALSVSLRTLTVTDINAFASGVRRHLTIEKATEDEWIGPAEAAEILKTCSAVLFRLVRARPDLVERRRRQGGRPPYLLADIQAISAKYIFVGEIAVRRQLHARVAVAWLRSVGVRPVFVLGEKAGLVYLRDDLEPLLDSWNTRRTEPRSQSPLKCAT